MTIIDSTISKNHPDLIILCSRTGTSSDELRGSSSPGQEYNYLKVNSLKTWDPGSIDRIKRGIALANLSTTKYTFELVGTSDYEVEFDNDRSWPASFSFKSIKK